MLTLFCISVVNMNVELIMPTYVSHNHATLNEVDVSFILIAFEVGAFIFSPIAGIVMSGTGRKNSILIGYILMIIADICVALTQFIINDNLFLYSNIVFRFLKGVGDVWIENTIFSIIMIKYPKNREKFIGLAEAAAGVGFMAGPAIGGILFNFLGFFWTFISFGTFLMGTMTICYFYLPDSLNNSVADSENVSILS